LSLVLVIKSRANTPHVSHRQKAQAVKHASGPRHTPHSTRTLPGHSPPVSPTHPTIFLCHRPLAANPNRASKHSA
jgi:hypothetical protein